MPEQLLQFLATGITIGSIYALVGLGFALIYNASDVVNFAQGEFVMLGAMTTVALLNAGLPLALAGAWATLLTALVGLLLERFAIEPAAGASVVSTIIVTIGAAIFLRGVVLLLWGRGFTPYPFTGDTPIHLGRDPVAAESVGHRRHRAAGGVGSCLFNRTLLGKALLACSFNRDAAQLVGIDVRVTLRLVYALSAALGALAGILIAPITFTSYEAGVMLGLMVFPPPSSAASATRWAQWLAVCCWGAGKPRRGFYLLRLQGCHRLPVRIDGAVLRADRLFGHKTAGTGLNR